MLASTLANALIIIAGQRLVLDLRRVSRPASLSTTHVGREVDRAIAALREPGAPSPIVFADGDPDASFASSDLAGPHAPRRRRREEVEVEEATESEDEDERKRRDRGEDASGAIELVVLRARPGARGPSSPLSSSSV